MILLNGYFSLNYIEQTTDNIEYFSSNIAQKITDNFQNNMEKIITVDRNIFHQNINKHNRNNNKLKSIFYNNLFFNCYWLWAQGGLIVFCQIFEVRFFLLFTVINVLMAFFWRFFIFQNDIPIAFNVQVNKQFFTNKIWFYYNNIFLLANYCLVSMSYESGRINNCLYSLMVTFFGTAYCQYEYFQTKYHLMNNQSLPSKKQKKYYNPWFILDVTYAKKLIKNSSQQNKLIFFSKNFQWFPFKSFYNKIFLIHFFIFPWFLLMAFSINYWIQLFQIPIKNDWIIYFSIHFLILMMFFLVNPVLLPVKFIDRSKKNFSLYYNKKLNKTYKNLKLKFLLINFYWMAIIVFTRIEEKQKIIINPAGYDENSFIFNNFFNYTKYALLPQIIYQLMVLYEYKQIQKTLNMVL